eukprot:GHVS01044882.1.p1 GENE.GHVS01044882.1~~GHVS01044882.1.p1  ORF type:complete len:110 (+),score=11.32 GHVS01044882.1:100-429(+)
MKTFWMFLFLIVAVMCISSVAGDTSSSIKTCEGYSDCNESWMCIGEDIPGDQRGMCVPNYLIKKKVDKLRKLVKQALAVHKDKKLREEQVVLLKKKIMLQLTLPDKESP